MVFVAYNVSMLYVTVKLRWHKVKCRAPELLGHTACRVGGDMMVMYGGTTDSHTELWAFHFGK